MFPSTKPVSNRIAIVFDFDETLVPESFKVLLEHFNLDAEEFNQNRVYKLVNEGWQKVPARAYSLIEESKQRNDAEKITQSRIAEFGRNLEPFPGVPQMFDRLRECARNIVPDVEVEFYLITGGFVEIARHTSIANQFTAMWGCEFSYDKNGGIEFLKQIMTHTEKTRYLFHISKGIDRNNDKDLVFLYQDIPGEELHVPLTQTIYVGDGTSDIPCFTVMNEHHGIAIGLYKDKTTEEWEHANEVQANQQVANLAPPDYSPDSELMRSLVLAVESISKQIALRALSVNK
ncbi:MAG: hypothetical protein WBB29_14510 [Geitlerinemataceae cyanobacterium]